MPQGSFEFLQTTSLSWRRHGFDFCTERQAGNTNIPLVQSFWEVSSDAATPDVFKGVSDFALGL